MALTYFIPPSEGLEEHSLYAAEACMRPQNPIFKVTLKVGFLDKKGFPTSYCYVYHQDNCHKIQDVYYLKIVRKLDNSIPNEMKLVGDLPNIFELAQYKLKKDKI